MPILLENLKAIVISAQKGKNAKIADIPHHLFCVTP